MNYILASWEVFATLLSLLINKWKLTMSETFYLGTILLLSIFSAETVIEQVKCKNFIILIIFQV